MCERLLPFTKERLEEIAAKYPTPFHIYDERAIRENAKYLLKAFEWNFGFKDVYLSRAICIGDKYYEKVKDIVPAIFENERISMKDEYEKIGILFETSLMLMFFPTGLLVVIGVFVARKRRSKS